MKLIETNPQNFTKFLKVFLKTKCSVGKSNYYKDIIKDEQRNKQILTLFTV